MIKYSQISQMGVEDFSREIKSLISKNVLFIPNKHEIVYQCLKCINYKNLTQGSKSIEEYCLKTIKALVPFRSLYVNPVDSFLFLVLDIKTLPFEHRIYLESETKSDLLEIEDLIKHYESLNFINQFNLKGNSPRNHHDNTILVFYQRTLKKRKAILDYLLYSLEKRAIEKSKPKNSILDTDEKYKDLRIQMENQNDFPYRDVVLQKKGWIFSIDFESLDYRRINPLRNKTFLFKFKSDTSQGYTNEINSEIEKKFKADIFLKYICEKVKLIPVISNRSEIFEELRELYETKKWYGFYALALPQIEGIFSEMISLVQPNKSLSGSLTDKVQFLRPFYDNSDYYFDYYEFHLPNQRNRFSHSGKDDNIKVKCSFLLLDIINILNIAEELNSSIIEINNIIKEGINYFKHIGKFSRFLFLIKKLETEGQLHLINTKLQEFINKSILMKIDFHSFLKSLQSDFINAARAFDEKFCLSAHSITNKKIYLFSFSNKDVIIHLKEIEEVFNNSLNIIFLEEFKLLIDTHYFISNFESRFGSVDKQIMSDIIEFQKINADKLEKIQILNAKLKIEVPEEFTISKNKWQHII